MTSVFGGRFSGTGDSRSYVKGRVETSTQWGKCVVLEISLWLDVSALCSIETCVCVCVCVCVWCGVVYSMHATMRSECVCGDVHTQHACFLAFLCVWTSVFAEC